MLPIVREALLEAWNHRVESSPWVVWCWRDPLRPSPYTSMHQQLRKLERAADVEHLPNRAFHAFRRSLATKLVEQLGVSQAARWIGDTPDVLLRCYLKPSKEREQAAAALLLNHLQADELQRNCNAPSRSMKRARQTLKKLRQRRTGAGGFEPPTSWLTARRSAN